MAYTNGALLYKMSIKLKKTEQRHCPPDPRATLPVPLDIFFVVYRVVFFVRFIVIRIKCPAASQFRAPSVALTKRRSLKTLPTSLLITINSSL